MHLTNPKSEYFSLLFRIDFRVKIDCAIFLNGEPNSHKKLENRLLGVTIDFGECKRTPKHTLSFFADVTNSS